MSSTTIAAAASHLDSSPSSNLHTYFNTQASTYEARTGGTTRTIARAAVAYLSPLPLSPTTARIHDNASGPGILTSELLAAHPSAHVTCTDNAQGMIDVIESLTASTPGWDGHVDAQLMSGHKLGFEDECFDGSVTNFGIFMFDTPEAGAGEIYRTLKRGGKAVVTAWKDAGWPRILRAVQSEWDPERGEGGLYENKLMERWSKPETLETCLRDGGFAEVEIKEVETAMWGEEVKWEEWMRDYAEIIGSMVGEALTGDEKGRLEGGLRGLWEGRREEFFIKGEEGKFGVRMIAWVGVAKK